MAKPVVPYGRWDSPISADLVATGTVVYDAVHLDGEAIFWLESRPEEGRTALVRWMPPGGKADAVPAGFDVGSRVHEYGGGAYFVANGVVVASNLADDRLYVISASAPPVAITPPARRPHGVRYADLRFVDRGRLLVCVRERHEDEGVFNELVAIPLDGLAEPSIIAGGHDFYSFPRPSPDGTMLAWTTWDQPQMPWDGTDLWVAALSPGCQLSAPRHVAGGPGESVYQPEWSPDGLLHFVSDRSGWWNLYRERSGQVEVLLPSEAEFGEAQWEFDYSTYAFTDSGGITCRYRAGGLDHLAVLDRATGRLEDLDLPFTSIKPYVRGVGEHVALVGSNATCSSAVASLALSSGEVRVLAGGETQVDDGFISRPELVDFPTHGGATTHAIYFPPTNPSVSVPVGELPPLIIEAHPGPTSEAKPRLELRTQFFTSRGFGVAQVNYRGSTGYGRPYRDSLNGLWGVADVEDCIAAARYLAEAGRVDRSRMVIAGASAGGFTALCALARPGVFAAATSYFGIVDLEAFAREAPKFQRHYLDRLVGPLPRSLEMYRVRSPLHFAPHLQGPVLLVYGGEDTVVPVSHAKGLAEELKEAGLEYECLILGNEGHGLKRSEARGEALKIELQFYGSIPAFDLSAHSRADCNPSSAITSPPGSSGSSAGA